MSMQNYLSVEYDLQPDDARIAEYIAYLLRYCALNKGGAQIEDDIHMDAIKTLKDLICATGRYSPSMERAIKYCFDSYGEEINERHTSGNA